MFKCENCNIGSLDPTKYCRNCKAKIVEYENLEVLDERGQELLKQKIKEGFRIIRKRQKIDRFDEQDFPYFEYELHRTIY